MLIAGIVITLLGGGLFWFSNKKKETSEAMKKTKVVPINQLIANTQAEAEGTVVAANPLKTPFSQRECVYYEYKVEKEVREKNNQGHWQTGWENVSSDKQQMPFGIQDNTGKVLINPEGASIEARDMGERRFGRGEHFGGNILSNLIEDLTNVNTRVAEKALFINEPVYVYGSIGEGNQGLQFGKGDSDYIISYRSEAEVEKSTARSAVVMKVLAITGVVGGIGLVVYSFVG